MMIHLSKDPFRIFFPIGIFCLLYACSLWISFGLFDRGEFPIDRHANLFIGGFLYFSIFGFLLTAIPRFTKTVFLSKIETSISFLIISLVLIPFFLENQFLFWSGISLGWLFLFNFASWRFLKRKENPPNTFVFIGFGLLLGFVGSLLLALSHTNFTLFNDLEEWGKIFFYDGMVMSFILGVGGRLIPGLLGFVEIVQDEKEDYEKPLLFLKVVPWPIYISLFIFALSLIFEALEFLVLGYVLRAIVISFFAFGYWKILEKVKSGKWHGRMINLACWTLVSASWLLCIFDEHILNIKHLIYIGTYCLMTILIASRVIYSHSNESLAIEHKKFPFLFIGILATIAAVARATAFMIPDSYIMHLGYAGLLLFLASFIWALFVLKKIIYIK